MRVLPLRLVALSLAVTSIGCVRQPGPDVAPAPGTYLPPRDIKFSVKVSPLRFALGEPVSLEATLFNDGRHVFEKKFGTGCQWDYEVAAENGRVVAPSRFCTMAESELRLEPGELRVIVREWRGNDDYFGSSERLPPGRYTVSAGFVDGHMRVVPMAEPVWIEILASRRR